MNRNDENIPFSYKLKKQIAEKWFVILGISFLSVLISMYNSCSATRTANQVAQDMTRVVKENLNSVLVATPDGRIAKVSKTPINASMLQKYVRFVVLNNLILDGSDLTNGFSFIVQSWKDLQKSYKIQQLIPFFPPESEKEGRTQFLEYLKYLAQLQNAGKLPEYIDLESIEDEKFETKGNEFKYTGVYNLKIKSLNEKRGTYSSGVRKFVISVRGFFDPINGSELNPYGLRFTRIEKISKITK